MTSISTRSSVLAIKKETTENTPVFPTSATDYIALQPDFSMDSVFENLTNDELKASIGKSAPIIGAEAPTASVSAYLRASGTVATAPNYGLLLEASLGAVTTASTEYDTVSSSTTSVIKVNTGEGATFQRGEALLIKDGTNGYRIRCIDSISSDDLTIGFQVPSAPASGVNLGKAVLYYPANTGHPTITLTNYVGNGGVVQMMSGARVTSASFDIAAGQIIKGSYNLEGLSYYYNPIEITSSTRYLDFTDDTGTFAASVAVGFYKDPYDLAEALTTAMNTANPAKTHTVTYQDTDGKFKIVCTGTVLTLKWNTGTNTANSIATKIGFTTAADSSGTAATTGYTSTNAMTLTAPQTPSYDSADPLAAKDNEVMVGDTADYACFKASTVKLDIATPKADILSVCEVSGKSGSIITSREVKVSIEALLEKYDVQDFKNFREGSNVKFQYSFGVKSGGSWVAGKCGALYCPTMKVSSFKLTDKDGLANVTMELTGYVNSSGEGECFVNFL